MGEQEQQEEEAVPLRVVLVGCGGIGGILAEGLVRMLEFKRPGSLLMLVDGDFYEPKNAERQLFKAMGNKAQVKAGELQPLFPLTYVVPLPKWVVDDIGSDDPEGPADPKDKHPTKVTATELLQDGDVVYAVVDNFACRALLAAVARNIPNIDVFLGGNDEALYCTWYHYQRRDGADVTEWPGEWHAELVDPPDRNPGQLSCAERVEIDGGTQFIATNFSVASALLGRTQHTIFDGQPPVPGEYHWDLGLGVAQGYDRRPPAITDPKEEEKEQPEPEVLVGADQQ